MLSNMIRVKVQYKDDKISKVSLRGHANYANFGKDIVCAAISSIVTTTVNAILTLDSDACKYEMKDGKLDISIKENSDIALKLADNMLRMLCELETQYPKNIEIGGLK